ncbi:MAG: hypothetical protein LBM12_01570 [Candidatus Nomurabacteria bacterium]|jgi:hypothetical protein|nr:hypothetical protein [Candidatus Nomurabacteria bacterium]
MVNNQNNSKSNSLDELAMQDGAAAKARWEQMKQEQAEAAQLEQEQAAQARGKKVKKLLGRLAVAGITVLTLTAAAAGVGLLIDRDNDDDGILDKDDKNPFKPGGEEDLKEPDGDADDQNGSLAGDDAEIILDADTGDTPEIGAPADSGAIDFDTASNDELINSLLNDDFIDMNNDDIDDRIAAMQGLDDAAKGELNEFVINEQAYAAENPAASAEDILRAAFKDVEVSEEMRQFTGRLAQDIYADKGETAPEYIDLDGDGNDDLCTTANSETLSQYTDRDGYLHRDREGNAFRNPDKTSANAFASSIYGELDGSDNATLDLNYLNTNEGKEELVSNWLHGRDDTAGYEGAFYQPGNLAIFAQQYDGDLGEWFDDAQVQSIPALAEEIENLPPDVRVDFNEAMTEFLGRCNMSVERYDAEGTGQNYGTVYYQPVFDDDGNIIDVTTAFDPTAAATQTVMIWTLPSGEEMMISTRCTQLMNPDLPDVPLVSEEPTPAPVITTPAPKNEEEMPEMPTTAPTSAPQEVLTVAPNQTGQDIANQNEISRDNAPTFNDVSGGDLDSYLEDLLAA